MCDLKIGDIVARKSYGCDVFFKIADIINDGRKNKVLLKGISYRIEADSPESDLELQPEPKVNDYRDRCCRVAERKEQDMYSARYRGYPKKDYYRDTSNDSTGKFKKPGKVLHLDGDSEYLEACMKEYRKLGISAVGQYIPEKEQSARIAGLLLEHKPDIIVLTGHDGVIKGSDSFTNIDNYRNSQCFIDAVKEARKVINDMDSLVIFAGACQSFYREIIKAGANFASAPFRDLIHALDPVRVCQKIAFTGVENILTAEEVIGNTITGKTGIGGVQTRGRCREGFPDEPY